MENFVNKIALVTGASSGIGAGIAKELVKRGCIVVGMARRLDKLQLIKEETDQTTSTTKGTFHSLQCDITDEQQLEDAFVKIKNDYGIPSILINNAGTMIRKKIVDFDGQSFDTIVNTNAKALFLATKLAIRLMEENSILGHVLNVNSIGGHYLPIYEEGIVYSGSKHMTRIFSEGIREMMTEKKLNIKISNISPGLVKTPLVEDYPAITNRVTMLSVEDVVKACIAILDTPPNVLNVSPGLVDTPIIGDVKAFVNICNMTILSVDDVMKACITIVDTPPNVHIDFRIDNNAYSSIYSNTIKAMKNLTEYRVYRATS